MNVKSDWQLINFEIYLHLNWKVLRGKSVFRKFANFRNDFFIFRISKEFAWMPTVDADSVASAAQRVDE